MGRHTLYFCCVLLLLILIIKSYWNYRNALKNGVILISKWARPISKWEVIWFIFLIYMVGDTIGNKLNRGYGIVVLYAVVIIVMTILNSKLLITDGGIYFMSQYTSWEKIDKVILVNDSMVNIRKQTFLSNGFKIRSFLYDDKFISIVEEKCVIKK